MDENEKITGEETLYPINMTRTFKQLPQNYTNKNKISLITKNRKTLSELNLEDNNNSMNNDENKDDSNFSYLKEEVNEELKPGEVIELNNGENLLCKKIDFEKISAKENYELNNKYVYKNKNIKILLKSLIEENDNM